MRFADVLKMATYWGENPPFNELYYATHFRAPSTEQGDRVTPNFKAATPYAQLSPFLQDAVRRSWLLRNPGKTEKDFFAHLKENAKAKYADRLAEARKKKAQT